MRSVNRGLIICPRPDLSTALVDVVEWRIRAHDGLRLWGLHGQSRFHDHPHGARIRVIPSTEVPEIDIGTIAEGKLEFVFLIPPGRKLEDRVLDLMRIWQVVAGQSELPPETILLVPPRSEERDCDAFMIAGGLISSGLA